ncbi:ArdC family protein [Hornefia porci]|uniref:ArdC family protein n=1 Tax=Hornefia porci TaxID=2652292 RepID=UPI0009FA869A|nr:zincin-like metallopeptidase domain-containing protein [Hornefia porci]
MRKSERPSPVDIVNSRREEVVRKILRDMEENGLQWAAPYLPTLSPRNPVSGTVYRGCNRLHLAYVGYMRGIEDNRWCTFKQIRDKGWHLKGGSKAAIIEKWKDLPLTGKNEDTGEDEVVGHYLRMVGYWNVFNAGDIEGIPPATEGPQHQSDYTAEIAENLIRSSRCPVSESSLYTGMAAYSPGRDCILIAPRDTFRSDESFTRTLLHEMTHSTGHPSALNRECSVRFGSPEYAEEELVAELGSLFLSSDLGIQNAEMEGDFYRNHVSYLQSWMKALKNDPAYLFKAAGKADKADTYIYNRYEDHLEKDRDCPAPEREDPEISLKAESAAMLEVCRSFSKDGGREREEAR